MSRAVQLAPWVIGGAAAGDLLSAQVPGNLSADQKDAVGIGAGAALGGGVGFGLNRARVDRQTAVGVGGGVAAGTTTAAIRERFDVAPDGTQRTLFGQPGTPLGTLGTPSVAWGLGAGALSLGLWWADFSGMMSTAPRDLEELWLGMGLGGVAAGTVSALMPKTSGSTTTASASRGGAVASRTLRQPSGSGNSSGGSGSDLQPAQ